MVVVACALGHVSFLRGTYLDLLYTVIYRDNTRPSPQNITKATLSEDEQSAYWLHKYTLRVAFHPETNEPLYDDTGLLVCGLQHV